MGHLVPPYLVLALSGSAAHDLSRDDLVDLVEDRARVLVVPLSPLAEEDRRTLVGALAEGAWQVDVHGEGGDGPPWPAGLAEGPLTPAHRVAHAFALNAACRRLVEACVLVLRQEGDALRVRKAQVDERVQLLKGDAARYRPAEMAREAESIAKQLFAEFDRGVTESLLDWTAAQTGPLLAELNEALGRLEALHEEPLSNQVVLTVPPDFERDLLDLLHRRLLERARRDLTALADLQELVRDQVNQRLRDAGAPAVPLSFELPAFDRFERFLKNRLHVEAPYRGEARAQGGYEYVMAARRYVLPFSMLIMPLGFLIAFLPRAEVVRAGLGVLMLLLFAFGGLMVRRRLPIERAEADAREREKAREALRRELRRMVADAEREWLQVLREHLRVEPARLKEDLEAALAIVQRQFAESQEQEHTRVERQRQGLEGTQRALAEADKQRSAFEKTFAQHAGALKQLYLDVLRDLRRTAGPAPPRHAHRD